jgi:hypothetical protein
MKFEETIDGLVNTVEYWKARYEIERDECIVAERKINELQLENAMIRDALKPFAQDGFCEKLGGNVLGNDSIIFQRERSKITLGDCRKARDIVAEKEAHK